MKIPLRWHDWSKIKKTGRGYTRRELTVVELLKMAAEHRPPRSFLNIGYHDYQDVRNRWWIDICRANDIDWHILEVFQPNVDSFLAQAPAADHHRITCGNLLDLDRLYQRNFDVILHWHGPEHLERQAFLDCLPALLAHSDLLTILGCPDGEEEQGQAYGNPFEEHLSFWSEEDFRSLGFEVLRVRDKAPGHLTAYRLQPERP